MWKIAAIGECMLELSAPDTHSLLKNMSMKFSYGGDTLNTLIYIARLGADCHYITALGDDTYSRWLLDEWQSESVRTDMVTTVPGTVLGIYFIQTDSSGERNFHYWRDSAPVKALLSSDLKAEIMLDNLSHIDVCYLSGITLSLFDEPSVGRLLDVLTAFKKKGGKIAFDGNYRPRSWKSANTTRTLFNRLLALSSIVLPTFDDEAKLFGDKNPEETVRRMSDFGLSEVVVKDGSRGALVAALDQLQWVPAPAVDNIVDTTSAGDSFNAGYLAARAQSISPLEAAQWGNRLAGTVIQYPGAIIPVDAMPDLSHL